MATQSAGSLVFDLIFKADQVPVNKFIRSLGDMKMSSVVSALGLKGIADAILGITQNAMGFATGLKNFSTLTGVSSKDAEQLGHVVERIGGKADSATQSLKALQDAALEAAWNGDKANEFQLLGVTAVDYENPIKMMDTMQRNLGKYDKAFGNRILQSLGMTGDMIVAMRSDMWAKRGEMPFMDESQIKKMYELMQATNALQNSWKNLMNDVSVGFFIPLSKAIDEIDRIVRLFSGLGKKEDFSAMGKSASEKLSGVASTINPLTKYYLPSAKMGIDFLLKNSSKATDFLNSRRFVPSGESSNKIANVTNHVTVNTQATNAKEVAEAVDKKLREHVNTAYRQINKDK